VAPRNHSEASDVAKHVNLARGWSRQLDRDRNPLFYDGTLTAASFSGWLQLRGVDYVALQRSGRLDWGVLEEARLLRDGDLALEQVWQDDVWTLWRVPWALPLVDAPAKLVEAERGAWRIVTDRAAVVHVRIRWSPWLSLEGAGCIARDGEEVELRLTGPGASTLTSSVLRQGHC